MKRYLVGLALLQGLILAGGLLTAALPLTGTVTLAVAGLGLAVWAANPFGWLGGLGGLALGGVVWFTGVTAGQWLQVRAGREAREVPLSTAPDLADVTRFAFIDGAPALDRVAEVHTTSRTKSGTSTSTHYVAPLVPPGWSPAQPVPAWLICGTPSCQNDWKQPHRAALRRLGLEGHGDDDLVRKACTAKGLTSRPGAPTLTWVASLEEGSQRHRSQAEAGLAAANSLWLLLSVFAGRGRGKG